MKRFTQFLFISLALVFVLGFGKCGNKPLPNANDADWKGVRPVGFSARTDRGVEIVSSVAIDPAIREQVDLGLNDLFEIAKAPPYNYSFTDDLNKWHIWLMPPNREKCIDPAFTLRTTSPLYPNGWDQDPTYDKDPREGYTLLCVAGFMERSSNEPGMVIVASVANARNTARFEGEHNVLLEADPEKFKATSDNHHHPLIPRADGSQIINSDTDSRSASVRLDELFVLPEGLESYGKTRIHIILSK